MAFYRGPQSPRDEHFSPNPLSPPERHPNRWSTSMASTTDVRGAMHRRFTTSTVPMLSPIGQQRRQALGDVQQPPAGKERITPSERAARHYESLLQAQRKIEEELEKVDADTRREVDENIRHEQSVTQLFAQSEPTTPPEYHSRFSSQSAYARPSRLSSALISPPGLATRPARASTQVTSPGFGFTRTYKSPISPPTLPSQSVPASRRQSDDEDEEDDFVYGFDSDSRRASHPNRNSMPVAPFEHRKRNTTDLTFGLNSTGFLFDGDEKLSSLAVTSNRTSPRDTKTYLQVQHTADGFPKLIRREENGEIATSPPSAALDLASVGADSSQQTSERNSTHRHRISLPPSGLGGNLGIAPLNSILANASETRPGTSNRRSMEVKFTPETKRPGLITSPSRPLLNGNSAQALSSYSTNDLPTLKSMNADQSKGPSAFRSPPSYSSGLHDTPVGFDHNGQTLSRLMSNQEQSSSDFVAGPEKVLPEDYQKHFQTALHANAPSFGPAAQEENMPPNYDSQNISPYVQNAAYYGGYGMQLLNNNFSGMSIGGNGGYHVPPGQWPGHLGNIFQPPSYNGYQQFTPARVMTVGSNSDTVMSNGALPNTISSGASAPNRFENPRASNNQRRQAAEEAQARFNSIKIDQLVGEIYSLCKDQHGCRFLQRKLEERDERTVGIIFDEVKNHMIDLMTDPFGNYLCQKLLESTNDEQRTTLIRSAMPDMTRIALNQHGTRALQKMIEFVTTPEQTSLIIDALGNNVVGLIQDLNGNHVIQKCLNHLSSQDAEFIFHAVGNNCVAVGTHRHGCCVLQRCIDHADGLQKGRMVDHVIRNAYALVQDPFGNYVVQYILDLNEACFTEPLCQAFTGDICTLSKQKFSSNVIEKCIRCASSNTRQNIVREIMNPATLEKLLRDGFANYVVQTAMDFADEETKPQLIDNIRAILPSIRNTPHGRRIQSKLSDFDNRGTTTGSAPLLSALESTYTTSTQAMNVQGPSTSMTRSNRQGIVGAPQQWGPNGDGFNNGSAFNSAPFNNGNVNETVDNMSAGQTSFGNIFNGGQNFNGNGYAGQGLGSNPARQPYGQI